MQKTNTKVMTSGNPAKLLLFFAVPLMLGNLFQQMYTMVDTIIVGQGVGVQALASLGAADWLNWLFLGLVTGLTQGFSIQISQLYGAGKIEKLKQTIGNSIVLTVGAAVVFLLIAQGGLRLFLDLMNTPSDIYAGSESYLRIMFGGIPVILAYNLAASILRALGDSKTPLYAMIIAACINIGLDLLFVMVFHWGIPGAAIATVIAQAFSFLFCSEDLRSIVDETIRLANIGVIGQAHVVGTEKSVRDAIQGGYTELSPLPDDVLAEMREIAVTQTWEELAAKSERMARGIEIIKQQNRDYGRQVDY